MRTERGYLQISLLAKKLLIRIWIYQLKKGPDGVIQRYKARWVVKRFQQREGIDYNETFASVEKPRSHKAIFAIAATRDWEIEQIDVKTAYLYGRVTENIYVYQPTGFSSSNTKARSQVCKLK